MREPNRERNLYGQPCEQRGLGILFCAGTLVTPYSSLPACRQPTVLVGAAHSRVVAVKLLLSCCS